MPSLLRKIIGYAGVTCALLPGVGFGLWMALQTSKPEVGRSPATTVRGRLAALDVPVHEITGFVQANCIECHNKQDHIGGLSLEKFTDAAAIRKDRATWAKVITLVGGGAMPPEDVEKPPEKAHREAFVASAKKVLAYTDPSRPDPGRVTLRRLNRVEYDNSVFALVGADLEPSREFPPDDVSGGFDNNGDGLTLSPLQMERYLVASDAILAQIMPEAGFWPLVAKLENLSPAPGAYRQTSLGRDAIRHLLPGMQLSASRNIGTEGDYVIKAFAYWHKGGGLDMPVLEMLWDDEVVYSGPVDVIGYEGSIFYETPPVSLKPGSHKMAIRWPRKEGQKTPSLEEIGAKESSGKNEPPGLFIRWAEISGPRSVKSDLLTYGEGLSPREAAREVIARIARKAYRRPVSDEDVDKLVAFYDASPGVKALDGAYRDPMSTQGLTWYQAVRPALQAILVSPHFLFRVEEDTQPDAPGPHPITDVQLASRLSYFLWSGPPDDELMALAEKNELHLKLEEQARRMLKDKRADSLTENFASQLLHLRMLDKVTPDKAQFPEYYQPHSAGRDRAPLTMRDFMKSESLKFFNDVQRQDRSILDLIDGHYTYLNGPLAGLYGIVDTNGNIVGQKDPAPGGSPIRGTEFVRVELQGARSGLLTQASFLTITSNPGRTSPVKRGKFVLEKFLGAAPPPPPPNVPELEATKITGGTLRQIMEQHRSNPACAACHMEMDSIGFSFENFDAIGRFREKEGGVPIDASGTFPGGVSFTGVSALQKVLRGRVDEFSACLAEQLMTYALGRQVQYFDKPAIDTISRAAAGDGYKFSRVIVEIVKSDPFRLRRGKDQTDE